MSVKSGSKRRPRCQSSLSGTHRVFADPFKRSDGCGPQWAMLSRKQDLLSGLFAISA
jgi:hypothetical protein